MRKMHLIRIIPALLLAASVAQARELSFDALPDLRDVMSQAAELETPTVAEPAAEAKAVKDWTIMVFINGKNNLSSYVIQDMNEMEQYGPTGNINIITQSARMKYTAPSYPSYPGGGYDDDWSNPGPTVPHPGWPNPGWPGGGHWHYPPMMKGGEARDATTDWTGVRRYEIVRDGDNSSISSRLIQDMGKVDMGDWRQLAEFGKWVKQNYPARRYMLIGWNHGSGWEMKGLQPEIMKGISYDDETGNHINTVELAQAIRGMGGVDIYASDACLMQMAEVVYELKDTAEVIIGSEENEPGDGWGYHEFLSRVHSNQHNLTPKVMAAAAVQGYKAFYAAGYKATTQSAVWTSGIVKYRQLLDQWVELAMQEDKEMIKAARGASLGFGGAGSRDLTHFMELVHEKTQSKALQYKTVEVMNHLYDRVLIDNATTGSRFEKAYGLAVYLPTWSFDSTYNRLAWANDGKWDEFVQWMTAK